MSGAPAGALARASLGDEGGRGGTGDTAGMPHCHGLPRFAPQQGARGEWRRGAAPVPPASAAERGAPPRRARARQPAAPAVQESGGRRRGGARTWWPCARECPWDGHSFPPPTSPLARCRGRYKRLFLFPLPSSSDGQFPPPSLPHTSPTTPPPPASLPRSAALFQGRRHGPLAGFPHGLLGGGHRRSRSGSSGGGGAVGRVCYGTGGPRQRRRWVLDAPPRRWPPRDLLRAAGPLWQPPLRGGCPLVVPPPRLPPHGVHSERPRGWRWRWRKERRWYARRRWRWQQRGRWRPPPLLDGPSAVGLWRAPPPLLRNARPVWAGAVPVGAPARRPVAVLAAAVCCRRPRLHPPWRFDAAGVPPPPPAVCQDSVWARRWRAPADSAASTNGGTYADVPAVV